MAESELHRDLKQVIARAFGDSGWEARQEVALPGGSRIDVLGEQGDERWAVEVQLSEQHWRKTAERTLRLADDGVRAVWLLAWPFRYLEDFPDLPAFTLARPGDWWHSTPRQSSSAWRKERKDATRSEVVLGSNHFPIAAWLPAFLEGRIRHCDESVSFNPAAGGELLIATGRCFECGRTACCLLVKSRLRSRCGVVSRSWLGGDLEEAIVWLLRDLGEPIDVVGAFEDDWLEWPGKCRSCLRGSDVPVMKRLEPIGPVRPVRLPRRYEIKVREELSWGIPRHWCLDAERGLCQDLREHDQEQARVAERLAKWVGERYPVAEEVAVLGESPVPDFHHRLAIERAQGPPVHLYCLGGPAGSFFLPVQDHASRSKGVESVWLAPGLDRVDQLPQRLSNRVVTARLGSSGVEIDERKLRQLLGGEEPRQLELGV
ncbi:MAG TPA: hypothetical protein VI039_04090 [Solirubrobacterales bacterium]